MSCLHLHIYCWTWLLCNSLCRLQWCKDRCMYSLECTSSHLSKGRRCESKGTCLSRGVDTIKVQGRSHEIWSGPVAVGGWRSRIFSASFLGYQDGLSWHLRALKTRKLRFQLFAAIDLYSVNCGHVTLYRSAGRAADYIGRKMVFALKMVRLKPFQPYRWLRPWGNQSNCLGTGMEMPRP